MTDETPINWLTQEAFDRLSAELAERSGPRRDITRRSRPRVRKATSRKTGATTRPRRSRANEARIVQLRHLLDHSEIGESPPEAAEGKRQRTEPW